MKVKNVLMAMVFSVAVLGGYQAYENVSITSVESFLLENIEALASTEYQLVGSSEWITVEPTCANAAKCKNHRGQTCNVGYKTRKNGELEEHTSRSCQNMKDR